MSYWFYVQTTGVTTTPPDGKVTIYPLASVMTAMKPLTKVTPSEDVTPEKEACNKAFALACRFFRGRDLVEEMVAAKYWPLGRVKPSFTLDMVSLPVFGDAEGVPFPQFGLKLPEG